MTTRPKYLGGKNTENEQMLPPAANYCIWLINISCLFTGLWCRMLSILCQKIISVLSLHQDLHVLLLLTTTFCLQLLTASITSSHKSRLPYEIQSPLCPLSLLAPTPPLMAITGLQIDFLSPPPSPFPVTDPLPRSACCPLINWAKRLPKPHLH